jgi:hypothetical protein
MDMPLFKIPYDFTGRNSIARLSHRHDAVMNWMLLNPHRNLRDCADELGYSQAWISQLIHSDIFQAQLKSRQEYIFIQVAQDIPVKLKGLADQAIEKVSQILERTEQPEVVVDIFDKTLNRLGYGPAKAAPAPAPQTQVNVFSVSKEDLAQARDAIQIQDAQTIEHEKPAPREQNSNQRPFGDLFKLTPAVP